MSRTVKLRNSLQLDFIFAACNHTVHNATYRQTSNTKLKPARKLEQGNDVLRNVCWLYVVNGQLCVVSPPVSCSSSVDTGVDLAGILGTHGERRMQDIGRGVPSPAD